MSDAKQAKVPCWGCGKKVVWCHINRVVALREKGQPEYRFCGDCMGIINAAREVAG